MTKMYYLFPILFLLGIVALFFLYNFLYGALRAAKHPEYLKKDIEDSIWFRFLYVRINADGSEKDVDALYSRLFTLNMVVGFVFVLLSLLFIFKVEISSFRTVVVASLFISLLNGLWSAVLMHYDLHVKKTLSKILPLIEIPLITLSWISIWVISFSLLCIIANNTYIRKAVTYKATVTYATSDGTNKMGHNVAYIDPLALKNDCPKTELPWPLRVLVEPLPYLSGLWWLDYDREMVLDELDITLDEYLIINEHPSCLLNVNVGYGYYGMIKIEGYELIESE